jgi:hypothetical protein
MARKGSLKEFSEMMRAGPPWFRDLEWLKLSNAALRAFPSSPRQKELQAKMRVIEARYQRESNPAKFDRCVSKVKRRGSAVNAYAVCTAALHRPTRAHGPQRKR